MVVEAVVRPVAIEYPSSLGVSTDKESGATDQRVPSRDLVLSPAVEAYDATDKARCGRRRGRRLSAPAPHV